MCFIVMNNLLPDPKLHGARLINQTLLDTDAWCELKAAAGLLATAKRGPLGALSVLGWDAKYDLKGCCDDKTQELDGCRIEEVGTRQQQPNAKSAMLTGLPECQSLRIAEMVSALLGA